MTRRFVLAAALLAAATLAYAQPMPPGKWWRRDEIVRQLQLAPEQQAKLDRVYSEAAAQLIDARGDVEKAQIALRTELEEAKPDRAAIQKIATRLGEARGRLFERELMMLLDMRAVLNDAQWSRMRQFLDRMEQNRRGRPDGEGPDGPPNGPPNGPNRGPGKRPRPM